MNVFKNKKTIVIILSVLVLIGTSFYFGQHYFINRGFPKGKVLFYKDNNLWSMNADGSDQKLFFKTDEYIQNLKISPDNKYIIGESIKTDPPYNTSLKILHLDDKSTEIIPVPKDIKELHTNVINYVWSLDSSKIAIVYQLENKEGAMPGKLKIYTIGSNTEPTQAICSAPTDTNFTSISWRNNDILYTSLAAGDQYKIVDCNTANSNVNILYQKDGAFEFSMMKNSPDSLLIENYDNLTEKNIQTGKITFHKIGSYIGTAYYAQDGKYYYMKDNKLYKYNLETKQVENIFCYGKLSSSQNQKVFYCVDYIESLVSSSYGFLYFESSTYENNTPHPSVYLYNPNTCTAKRLTGDLGDVSTQLIFIQDK